MSSEGVAQPETGDAEFEDPAVVAELEVLREENRRLREEFAAARRAQYRRTALALVGIGVVAGVAGLLLASARSVLLALAGTGVFLGTLIYYLTPEQFIAADVGQRVYEAFARNGTAIAAELGLQDDRVYVPTGESLDDVRLFVPQRPEYDIPDRETLQETFVVTAEETRRGIALDPTGGSLAGEFERALTGDLSSDPDAVVAALSDALVEQFELISSTSVETATADGRVTVGVTDSTYGPVDRFDHPVVSFLAVGLAGALDRPVRPEVTAGDERTDYLVTCRWETDAE